MNFDTLESTKDRLENWKKAYRNHKSKRVTMSLEGRYQSPQQWEAKDLSCVVDLLDAHKIETEWLSLPVLNKEVLKYNYFTPHIPINVFCRAVLKIRPSEFESQLLRSINMMDNRLR